MGWLRLGLRIAAFENCIEWLLVVISELHSLAHLKYIQIISTCRQKNTPEFYDDDVPLLLLGSVTPSALLEEDGEALSEIYGLMQACGSQSVEHDGLKRSARHSMMLLQYLVCDYVEMENGQKINNTSVEEGGEVRDTCCYFFC